MTCSFFTDQNFVDPVFVNVASASSQKPNFPASNLYDRQQRSKVWRSAGYFNVTSSNNTLVFRETMATDLTATLTVGEYVTEELFAAEVKLALETAGASTYTVVINSTTGKWQITSNGAGGGGIFEIIWTDGDSAGIAGLLGFGVSSDDTGGLTYQGDYININTEEFLLWDFGLPSLPTCFFALSDRNSPIPLSPSATITLEGNHTNNFSTAVYSQVIPYDSRVIGLFDSAGLGTTYLRYWRLKLDDTENSNGFLQLGFVHLGSLIQPSRGRITFGFSGSYIDLSDSIRVVGGQVYSNVRSKSENFSLTWEKLTKQDKELFDDHFNAKGKNVAFLASFDPDEAISTDKNKLTRLVKYDSEPQWSIVSANNYTVQMNLQEVL